MSCLCSLMCSKHSSMLIALFVVTCCVFFFFGWKLKSQSQFSDSHHSFSIHEQPTQTVTDMFGSTVSSLVNAVFESTWMWVHKFLEGFLAPARCTFFYFLSMQCTTYRYTWYLTQGKLGEIIVMFSRYHASRIQRHLCCGGKFWLKYAVLLCMFCMLGFLLCLQV